MTATNLTSARLREVLSYNPETGVFVWLIKRGRKSAGSTAGTNSRGYTNISVDGRLYGAHRLAWFYIHGNWPINGVDHKNGVRFDNRIGNLREATQGENLCNQRAPRSDNKSGFLGVSWAKTKGKWRSAIQMGGKSRYLGLFEFAEDAHAAYLAAKRELHPFCTI